VLDFLAGLAVSVCHAADHLVVSFAAMLFFEYYDANASSDVFFWASYFGAVSYWCDFAFKEACYAAYC
jgi:hypothetical protein